LAGRCRAKNGTAAGIFSAVKHLASSPSFRKALIPSRWARFAQDSDGPNTSGPSTSGRGQWDGCPYGFWTLSIASGILAVVDLFAPYEVSYIVDAIHALLSITQVPRDAVALASLAETATQFSLLGK
jgi:hypothetical protein